MERILRYTCILLISLIGVLPCSAQKKSKYRFEPEMPPAKLFNGLGVGIDGVGLGMKAFGGRFANMEVMARVNFLEKYFPIYEMGMGDCTREGNEQNTVFHTRAPYFRIGADYCFTKKRNGNRLLGGLRYGFSRFDYDYSNPDFVDEVYGGGTSALNFKDMNGKTQWIEACVGVETRIWKFIRLGWTLRFKFRVYSKYDIHGDPWYVPGYGKNGSTTWGGSVNLMFDVDNFIDFSKVKTKLKEKIIKKIIKKKVDNAVETNDSIQMKSDVIQTP